MRTLTKALLVVGSCLVGAWSRPVAAQFNVDELEIHIVASGSAPITRAFSVRSTADTVQQLQFEIGDWSRDSAGVNQILPLGTHEGSCAERVEIFPQTLQLRPGAVEFVRVTYSPAATQPDPGCWAMISTRSVSPPTSTGARLGVTITTVIGVKLYVHTPNEIRAAEVISADFEQVYRRERNGDSTLVGQVAVRLANTGSAHLKVTSKVEVRNQQTELLRSFVGPEAYLTPRAFRDIVVPLPDDLPSGRYVIVMLLDYGGDEITAAQVEVEVP